MLINDAGRWRRRAEEARALAKEMNGDQAKVAMLGVADDYDKIAQRAEEWRATRPKNSQSPASGDLPFQPEPYRPGRPTPTLRSF